MKVGRGPFTSPLGNPRRRVTGDHTLLDECAIGRGFISAGSIQRECDWVAIRIPIPRRHVGNFLKIAGIILNARIILIGNMAITNYTADRRETGEHSI
jgi:hypothetical protein